MYPTGIINKGNKDIRRVFNDLRLTIANSYLKPKFFTKVDFVLKPRPEFGIRSEPPGEVNMHDARKKN